MAARAAAAEADDGVILLSKPVGQFAGREALSYYEGCLLTQAETEEVRSYGRPLRPMGLLPRKALEPPGDGARPNVQYRRRVYGPYDHLPLEQAGERPVYTFRYAAHRGQTKLCAIEMEALTRAVAQNPDLKYVVYAGAAPGEHIAFLAEAFSMLEFHLYDPAEFRVHCRRDAFPEALRRIHTTRGLFTDDTARAWTARGAQTVFLSDIRSGSHDEDEFEKEVWRNMQMQRTWWEIIRPAASLFKFRLPYTDGSRSSDCEYLDGEILLQPFGPNTSTEGRLYVKAGAGVRLYGSQPYEDFFFWLNNIVREWGDFDHGLSLSRVEGLCRCFDCARLVEIFRGYESSRAFPANRARPAWSRAAGESDANVAWLIGRMVEATSQRLLHVPHGVDPSRPLCEKRLGLAQKYGGVYVSRSLRKIQDRKKKVQHAPTVAQKRAAVTPAAAPATPAAAPATPAAAPATPAAMPVRRFEVRLPPLGSFQRGPA
jgi:hypothetical protein